MIKLPECIMDLLLLQKTLNSNKFAVLKKTGGGYCYVQPNRAFMLPSLGYYPPTGILLNTDIKKNLEVLSKLVKTDDFNIVYMYPTSIGIKFKICDPSGLKPYEGEIKLISGKGIGIWVQRKILRFLLWRKKNELYKLF